MNILLADQERDLLLSYKQLLEYEGHKVTTVFDGIQAINILCEYKFDIVIINRDIPRVNCLDIVKQLNDNSIPSIVLMRGKVTPAILLDKKAASSYINFPFMPQELRQRIESVCKKSISTDTLTIDGVTINAAKFCTSDGTRFTNEEIDILTALSNGKDFELNNRSSYINAINNKFEQQKKSARVKYILNEGYRLVKNNE